MNKRIVRGLAPGYERKLSDVLLEFANEILPLDASNKAAFENAVSLAIAVWNLGVIPEESQGEELFILRQKLGLNQNPLLATELDSFLEIRKNRHRDDRRFVARFKLAWNDKGPLLSVESYDWSKHHNTPT